MVVKLIILTMRNWFSTSLSFLFKRAGIVTTFGSSQVILITTTWASEHYNESFLLLHNKNLYYEVE